jgi:hypothetical protein
MSFDPRMRTFCTGYDPDGIIVVVGKSDISRIYRLCNSYDKLQSKWSQLTTKHAKRYRYKKAEQGFNVVFKIWLMNSTKKKMGLRKLQYYIPTQIWDSEDDF